jgi:hypothetical protein
MIEWPLTKKQSEIWIAYRTLDGLMSAHPSSIEEVRRYSIRRCVLNPIAVHMVMNTTNAHAYCPVTYREYRLERDYVDMANDRHIYCFIEQPEPKEMTLKRA